MASDAGSRAGLQEALALLASDPARAETLARAALAEQPADVDAQAALGTALRLQNRLAEALAVLQPLATAETGSWIAQFELSQVLFALGETRAASAPLKLALALNPGLAVAWRLAGDLAMISGDFTAARTAYDRFLAALAADPRLRGPAEALAAGRLERAEQDLRAVLAADPRALAAGHLLGEVLGRGGRLADAEALLAQIVQQAPEFALARQSYASVLTRSGKAAQALPELDRLIAADAFDNRSRIMRSVILTELGDYAAAAEAVAALLKVFPDQPHAWLILGASLRTLGRIDEAIAAYSRCLTLDPESTAAWWSLANLKTYRFAPEARAAIQARLAGRGLSADDRANLQFTLGKVEEDDGRFAEAFAHYAEANAIQHGLRGYDPDRTSAFVERAKALFTPAFFAERQGWGDAAADPIFIVGLPRSGSSLVDQMLASHPAIEGTRELQEIQLIADWVAGPPNRRPPGYPDELARLSAQMCAEFGRDYIGWTRPLRRLGRPYFTDKAPWNFLHVGLIQLILPRAKIIDVRRHPLACGFSAFKQHFAQGWDFSYDLTDLGRYYADYVELMAHMDAVLPGRVHRVFYEALVAEPDAEVRRLLDHLDLPFDAACLRFFDNPRPVATPSSEQVRRPIFTEAVHHWRNFERWLGPLKAALGPVLDAYPDVP